MFAIGLALEGIGHFLYFLLEWIREDLVEFPSIADFLWIVGLRIYCYQQTRGGVVSSLTRTFVANTIFIVLVVLQLSFFTIPVLYDASEALWIRIAYQIYPTLDLSLAYFCLHLALAWLSKGFARAAKPWTVLVLAFIVFLIADYGYEIYLILDSYHSYLWINPSWMLGYLLVVAAAYLQWNLMLHLSPLEEDAVSLNE